MPDPQWRRSESLTTTWLGREVTNPIGRAAIIGVGSAMIFVAFSLIVFTTPLWLLTDYILKRIGRRGFLIPHGDGTFSVQIEPEGFRRASGQSEGKQE